MNKLLLTALVVGMSLVNAGLFTAVDHIDMQSNTNGQLTLWFSSTEPATYVVSSEGAVLTTVSPSSGVIGAGAVESIRATFSVPLCSEGVFYKTINVDLITASGTERLSKTIELNVQRSADCNAIIYEAPQNLVVSSANSISGSVLSLASNADASEVSVVIRSSDGKSDIANGEYSTVAVDVVNRGSPGLVTLQLISEPELGASISDYSFVLERSEVKRLTLSINPRGLQGRKWIEVQATRAGVVVAVKRIYFDIANSHLLELGLPTVVQATNCGVVSIAGNVANKGSAAESVSVSIPALNSASNTVTLAPRTSTQLVMSADLSLLSPGVKLYEVVASSPATSTKQIVRFEVVQCEENILNYTISVTNTGNETLKGVVASVVDIPAQWEVLTQYPVDIAPGETKTLTALVKTKGEWESDVMPSVVVKDADGTEIKRQSLSPIKANKASGLFLAGVAGLSGLQWVAVIVFVALVVAVASARASLKRTA